MKLSPIAINCPGCGSKEIVYSCTPDCCFNHVCGDCLNNFQLLTKDLGETLRPVKVSAGEKDTCAPTASCARCESLDVYQLEGESSRAGNLVCAACGALLGLEISFD